MESNGEPNIDQQKRMTVEDLNIEILPVFYEIIKSVEKDHHDNTVKSKESQDCSQKVLELQKRLDQTRSQIRLLPGIDYSKEQQLQHLEALKTQLRLKQELLCKYRFILLMRYLANNEQLVHRLSQSYPIRRAAQIVVLFYMKSKHMIRERGLEGNLTPEQFEALMKNLRHNLQRELKQAHERFKIKRP